MYLVLCFCFLFFPQSQIEKIWGGLRSVNLHKSCLFFSLLMLRMWNFSLFFPLLFSTCFLKKYSFTSQQHLWESKRQYYKQNTLTIIILCTLTKNQYIKDTMLSYSNTSHFRHVKTSNLILKSVKRFQHICCRVYTCSKLCV